MSVWTGLSKHLYITTGDKVHAISPLILYEISEISRVIFSSHSHFLLIFVTAVDVHAVFYLIENNPKLINWWKISRISLEQIL